MIALIRVMCRGSESSEGMSLGDDAVCVMGVVVLLCCHAAGHGE